MQHSRENRRHRRINMNCWVEVNHPSIGKRVLESRNLSDGGLYLRIGASEPPPVGTILQGQVQGMKGDAAPIIDMEVVHSERGGIGLRFLHGEPMVH